MPVNCFVCNKVFVSQSSMNRHKRNVHNKNKTENYCEYAGPTKFSCLACNSFFKFNRDLRRHLAEEHGHSTELLEMDFIKFAGKDLLNIFIVK